MCDEWRNSFDAFRDWAYANGYKEPATRKDCTIDRKDNNGNYCPENCRWVTQAENNLNKRNTRIVRIDGAEMNLHEAANRLGITYIAAKQRKTLEYVK
jgi:hypothetical protein